MLWAVLIQDPDYPEVFVASGLPNFTGTPEEAEAYRLTLQATKPGACYAMQEIGESA